jgi:cyanate permease
VFALTVGWRWAFVAASVLAVVGFFLVPASSAASAEEGASSRPGRIGPLTVLAVGGGFGAAAANALGSFMVAAAVAIGLAEERAGLLLAMTSVVVLAVRITMGLVADRRGRQFFQMVVAMLALGAVGYVLLAGHSTGVFVAGAVLACGIGWGWPGLFNLAVVDSDRGIAAVATGITQSGVYAGGVVGPLGFGAIAEHVSFATAWLVTAVISLAGAAVVEYGRRRLARATSTEPEGRRDAA